MYTSLINAFLSCSCRQKVGDIQVILGEHDYTIGYESALVVKNVVR